MLRSACLCLILGMLAGMPTAAVAEPVQEYELKTAYLYNFALFTQWPQDWPPEAGNSMSICTIGEDRFGPALDQLQGRAIRDKRLIVRRAVKLEDAHTCHVLYIAVSGQENLATIYESLRNSSVLTVSDLSEVPPMRSVINMAIENKRLIFEVDSAAARQARLSMSSKLLHLAKRVY